ncbi:sensor histidine kinase, PAS domain-containing [Citrifermentans bemidjiense Bem]|uniref:histidine kinase n=1 Tax=Citrifermentans bemidjiense (strain ATCC BAA-1014 / DSM 16622 / JCM 12645 / Bem) TaxID=404380 RepID=B5E8Y1_CITBB|nr:MEDS domain-containing protein [Citrifermentans bemidjiense]ACH40145.1 sensor histidine kinase, PAS domain-containing [Citrifermentans bemidjiense Bem]
MEDTKELEFADIGTVNCHDHICLIYHGEGEIYHPVFPFIQKGVAIGERCIYLHGSEDRLERLLQNAVSSQQEDSGALILFPLEDFWHKDGAFKQERVLKLLHKLCAAAIDDGFSGTRVICDMGWAVLEPKRQELLQRIERELTAFASQNDVTLLCLYNRELFPEETILELAKLHPQVIVGGRTCSNPFYFPAASDRRIKGARCEVDVFMATAQRMTTLLAESDRLKQELEQAYGALARKIYENWQEEDSLRANEKEMQEKDEALLEHKRKLQTILQHIPAMLMAFDSGDRLAACNHEFERATGFRVEEVIGKPMLELLHVEGEQREEVVSAHPRDGGDYRGREWSLRCRDNSVKTVAWSNISRYVPIRGWNNWIVGLDVSAKLHAENALKGLRDELEARNAELEAFGEAVSHDLSGRLARIGEDCRAMQKLYGGDLSTPCREMLQKVGVAALELAGPIAALQRLTALAAAGLQPEEVDLSAMASEIAEKLSDTVARPVTFRIEDGVTVTGDREMLRLAMEQLLENAFNCTVGVKHPVIKFGTAQVKGERSFYVSDNGPRPGEQPGKGIVGKAEGQERISSGIGLATVQRIINLHRGRFWCADQTGRGGTLYFQV